MYFSSKTDDLQEVQALVAARLRSLAAETAPVEVAEAAQRLGCGVERLLFGGLAMPVQVGRVESCFLVLR